ncbi:MAG: hypothetical protein ACFFCW_31665 [Candidatus Hodarchaeota archaeon]
MTVNPDTENYVLFHAEGKEFEDIISGISIHKINKKEEVIEFLEGSIESFGKKS